MLYEFPKCQKCDKGVLLPLSDYGELGSSVTFKAWACSNAPACKFQLRVDKGTVTYGESEPYEKKRDEHRKRAS